MKYRVAFEASAAIGIEVEVEADSSEQAEALANQKYPQQKLEEIAGAIFTLNEDFPTKVNAESGLNITFGTLLLDEGSFDLVDCFLPDNLNEPQPCPRCGEDGGTQCGAVGCEY